MKRNNEDPDTGENVGDNMIKGETMNDNNMRPGVSESVKNGDENMRKKETKEEPRLKNTGRRRGRNCVVKNELMNRRMFMKKWLMNDKGKKNENDKGSRTKDEGKKREIDDKTEEDNEDEDDEVSKSKRRALKIRGRTFIILERGRVGGGLPFSNIL